jgi:3-hydroxyisobutyrate dehydrogenase-like beta-hydroxyacid dehydrogenase
VHFVQTIEEIQNMSVGFAGLGNMGQGMVDNLLQNDVDLTVFNRTRSKVEAMIDRGARGAASIAELTRTTDVVCICLADVQSSREALLGENGAFANAKPGQVFVDHGTVDIATSRECAAAAAAKGAHFLDAPISGGPAGANAGTLTIMVGGTQEAFDIAHDYLAMMGANVKLMGPTGAGTAMKLINQLLVGVHTVAAAEAFTLANSAGVDVQVAADLLSVSWGGSTMVERSAPITASRAFADSGAPLRLIHKDLTIIKQLANDESLSLELTLNAQRMYDSMMESGKNENDIAAVIELIEERSK